MTESSLLNERVGYPEPSVRWRWIARCVMLLPIVVAVVRAIAHDWFPVGDSALLAVRAYDVGTSHHPLLGSWTSASYAFGIDLNNPGPLYHDLAAPFMWTFGRAFGIGVGTAIAIGSINAAAALSTALVGARIGGWRAERWMLLLVTALMWAMGSELLIDIWQPHALLIPFCLLVAVTIGVASGDTRLWPVLVGVASLVVQTHLGYVYVVGALGAVAAVATAGRLIEHRGDASSGDSSWGDTARRVITSRTMIWTLLVLAVAWAQPIWEQLFGRGEGNLQRLITHAGGGDLTVGPRTAVKIVAAVAGLPPWWTRFGFVDSIVSTELTQTPDGPRLFVQGLPGPIASVLALALLAGVLTLLILALRAPTQRVARWAVVVSGVMLVVAVVGLAIQVVTVTGLRDHQVRWLFALSAIVQVSIAWGFVEWAAARWPATPLWRRWVDIAIAVLIGVLTVANLPAFASDLGPTADRAAERTLRRTFRDLSDFHPDGPVVYDVDNLRVFEPNSSAVMMRLRELGVEFRFDDGVMVRQFGDGRRADGTETTHLRQYERTDALLYDGDGCVVSLRSALPRDEEAAVDAVIAAAADDLAAYDGPLDVTGLPDDVRTLVESATSGDHDAAFRLVAQALLPVLVEEGRIEPTPAITAAVAANDRIVERVNSTFLLVATPSTACDRVDGT